MKPRPTRCKHLMKGVILELYFMLSDHVVQECGRHFLDIPYPFFSRTRWAFRNSPVT